MNTELAEVIKTYATKSHEELSKLLLGKSKDQLIAIFTGLLTAYINDKNSSTIREFVTVSLAGYTHQDTKIGYNGFKQNTAIGAKIIAAEAKPQNINTEDNKKKKNPRKLDGGGNFTDYTYNRLTKDLRENPNLLVSGFIDGQLVYIMEFPFNHRNFVNNIKRQLQKHFPNGDESGKYLRGAIFNFENYKNSKKLRFVYLDKNALKKNKINFTRNFFNFLNKNAK